MPGQRLVHLERFDVRSSLLLSRQLAARASVLFVNGVARGNRQVFPQQNIVIVRRKYRMRRERINLHLATSPLAFARNADAYAIRCRPPVSSMREN